MAKGLDELIDWLVAETAYCGETGLAVADFVAAVSRFLDGPSRAGIEASSSSSNNSNNDDSDNALARKAWEWLVERPEIVVGRHGCRGRMTLDEALALPEPAPVDDRDDMDGIKTEDARSANASTPKKVSFAIQTAARASRRVSAQRTAAAAEDPSTRPRLFATDETIWHALTGHDVDHKKIPPLEWKCLMGIASARADGILQGDLRALVDQDKRSVPKRTDFLASKGYAVKRTTIARGYRTSMLWLTEFAPAELDADAGAAAQQDAAAASLADTDTAGLDLSPDFLRKNLDAVPWRNRWIGDAIEFASFGQTILAIVKAWGVIRVVDLKHKLGIVGQRWQMRTLARACREFVESGILRFVAAMRADERKLFKDCIKYERDPTPHEWAVYLAAGRRRAPITEVRARHRRDQERRIRSESVAVAVAVDPSSSVLGDSTVGSIADDADFDDDAFDLDAAAHAMWQPGVPLLNLVFDTVARAGTAGITSPEICRLTVGTRYARYMFALITALSKPASQPPHLARFQLHCEPDRVGKNKAYLFRTRANYRRAKEEAADDEAGSRAASPPLDAARHVPSQHALSLHERGALAHLPASEVRRLFGFTAAPVPLSAVDAMDRLTDVLAEQRQAHRRLGRPRKADSAPLAASKPASTNKGKMGGRRGRPPKRRIADDADVSVPKRPRGRPRKAEAEDEVDAEEHTETAEPEDTPNKVVRPNSPTPLAPGRRGRKPRSGAVRALPEEVEDEAEMADAEETEAALIPVHVLYHGTPGTLAVDRAARTLVFAPIRRRGRPKVNQPPPATKEPIVIDAAKLASEPAIRSVPGTDDRALVVEVDDGDASVWPYTFVLSGDNDGEADRLLRVLLQMRAGTNVGPAPASAAPAKPPKAKHVGPYVCEKCGNTWKNLLGLQYHQTKARTPCNPDYAAAAAPAARKEKAAADVDDAISSRPRLRQRKLISFADMDVDGDDETDAEVSDAASDADVVRDGETLPAKKTTKAVSTFNTETRRRLIEPEEPASGVVPSFRGITGASRVSSAPRKLQPLPPRAVEVASVPHSTPETKRAKVLFPADRAAAAPTPRAAPETVVSRPQTPAAYPSPTPACDVPSSVPSAVSTPFKSAPMPAALVASASLGTSTPAPFRMPPLPRNYAKASIFILRALRTVEIIRYLVSCYDDGVFPSDRSLWYACYAIYTRTFPGQDPPTLNVTKASLKKLELAKVLEEHTFGFRDARGQFIYCRLVARPGTELFHSATAKEMKRNIQAAYPKPFVPAEFAPSAHDMAVLRVMDKEFGKETPKNVRGRRTLAPEIEVLKAPVYERPTPTRTAIKTVLVLDYDDDDADENENEDGDGTRGRPAKKAKGTPGRKRKAGPDRGGSGDDGDDFAGALSRVSNGQSAAAANAGSSTPGSNKKRRAKFADFIAGKAEARWARRDTDYDDTDYVDNDNAHDDDNDDDDDIDANIDPLLRDASTMRIRNKPGPRPKTKAPANPGLDTLPDYFYAHAATSTPSRSAQPLAGTPTASKAAFRNNKNRPAHLRAVGADGHATFVHFLPPNTSLGEDQSAAQLHADLRSAYSKVTPQRRPFPRPRAYKIVTKMFTLEDNRRAAVARGDTGTGAVSWPNLTETVLQRHSDSSVTMDGFMPTAKALVRANLPRSAAACASLLRKNHVLAGIAELAHDYSGDLTPAERMLLDIDYCRAWEHSQPGRDLLNNASVAPTYVFLHMAFAGAHATVRSDDYVQAATALWVPENQYTVETLPYAALADEELFGDERGVGIPETAATESPVPARARNAAAANAQRSRDTLAQRDRQARQARQAKYVMSSRRAMTAYPAAGELVARDENEEDEDAWNSDETLLAAFIAVRTLLGGLGNAVDWGLMMRLFPDRKLSALRAFWSTQRKRKQVYIDKYTERFQSDFLEAYDCGALPPLDYDDVVAYDWRRLVRWTVHMIRHSAAVTLPATRAALEDQFAIVDMVASAAAAPSASAAAAQAISASLQQASAPAVPSWREDYFHVARSVWNRLQDSAGEAAYKPVDAAAPSTPAEAAAAMAAGRPGALDALRFMVARSWIRALCGTPHDRYKPALIKEKLLSLRHVGAADGTPDGDVKRDEATTNALLQIVIGNLTHARILRRSKSMVAVSGRMYQMAELYETTLDKAAMEDKFRQAWAFKERLDSAFRRGASVELPTNANDDGMMMALVNLQAHGRVALEAVDAPHVPFGFEPGNYETRKFPKHYQRFHQRIVPRDYVYNDDVQGLDGLDGTDHAATGAHGEKPIWRDFFGVLDRQWFTRLASAVVFSLATRGATPAVQTAAHLRPVIEPFEVQMITAWAARAGILKPVDGTARAGGIIDSPPGSAAVTEWWWLMVGKMYTGVEEKKGGRAKAKTAEQ